MAGKRIYRYDMGFAINGTPIPDPYGFSEDIADLDSAAERTSDGLLHRARIATKTPTQISYRNIGWDKCQEILALVTGEKFTFTFYDLNAAGMRTGDFYAGDRSVTHVWAPAGAPLSEKLVNLSFSIIEY